MGCNSMRIRYHAPPLRKIPLAIGPLAQSVEQLAFNQLVDSSNLSRPTIPAGRAHSAGRLHLLEFPACFQADLAHAGR